MPLLSRFSSLLRNLFARERIERDLDDELSAYLEEVTEEKLAAGMTPAEALRAARIEVGGLDQVKEQVRHVRTGRRLADLLQDLRYAVRVLRKNPAFAAVAITTLALGIGANTAMFSVAYGILLRPLPYPGAERVAVVFMRYFPRDFAFGTMCMRDYLLWKAHNHAFEDPSLFRGLRMDIWSEEGAPEQVQGATVTAGFFSTLGAPPLIGRTFATGEDDPAAPPLAVLSESIWRRRFDASPAVVGRTILVNGVSSTVIGVMPFAFSFPHRATEVWTNLRLVPPTRYGPWFYRGIARLKPRISIRQAYSEAGDIAQLMMQQNPDYKRLELPMLGLRDALLGTTLKPALLVMTGAVGMVLLIAVVNVANLMLARATVRRREMALRLSLGAGRGRLVRQLLTESVLLAASGGTAGLVLAWASVEAIGVLNPGNLPMIESVRLDGGALAFAAIVSALVGIMFGLVPALECTRADLNSSIKEDGRTGVSRTRGQLRASLVVCQIAVSLMLVVGAGLLLRTFVNLRGVTGGFTVPPRHLLTMLISPGNNKYGDARIGIAFYDEVLRRARSTPGVQSAALTDSLPPDRQGDADTFVVEGQGLAPGELNPVVSVVTGTPDLFQALGIPLLKGRCFTPHDSQDSTPVAMVSEAFARRFFPEQEAVGKRIKQSGPGIGGNWMQIVGVVGNVKYLGLTVDTDPAYYVPFAQAYSPRMFLVVRASGDAAPLATALRRETQSIDPGLTLAQLGTMEQAMNLSLSQPRFDTLVLASFAAIALLLAAVGIYGLIAYSVAQRTHEIGVRMALGASRADVMGMIMRQSVTLAGLGIATGLAGAFTLARLLRTMLFGVGTRDVFTFAAAPLALMLVALLATLIPALRATRVSPIVALRYE